MCLIHFGVSANIVEFECIAKLVVIICIYVLCSAMQKHFLYFHKINDRKKNTQINFEAIEIAIHISVTAKKLLKNYTLLEFIFKLNNQNSSGHSGSISGTNLSTNSVILTFNEVHNLTSSWTIKL